MLCKEHMFCNRACKSRSEWSSKTYSARLRFEATLKRAKVPDRHMYVAVCSILQMDPNGVANCDLPQPMIGYYLHLFAKSPTKQLRWHKKFHSIRAHFGTCIGGQGGAPERWYIWKTPRIRFRICKKKCTVVINKSVMSSNGGIPSTLPP